MKTIPIQDAPAFTQNVSLDGTIYRLSLRFNWRGQFWSMGISNAAGVQIMSSVKLVVNYLLTEIYIQDGMPPGYFGVIDPTGIDGTVVDRDTLGDGVFLIYVTEAEREAL